MEKMLLAIALVLVSRGSSLAQVASTTSSQSAMGRELQRDLVLEQQAALRHANLVAVLQPEAREKLSVAVQSTLRWMVARPGDSDVLSAALREINGRFPRLSKQQADLLTLYVMAELTRVLAVRTDLDSKLDSMNELSSETSVRLQMMMDKRSQFMSMLSNIMKASADTRASVIGTLK